MIPIGTLLSAEVCVINVGLEGFALDLEQQGVSVIHVQWTPPAGGDPVKAWLLARLADDDA